MLSAMHIGAIFHLDVMTNNYAGVHHNLLARELPICDIRIDDNNFSVNYHNEDIAGIIGPRITIGLGDNPTSAQLNIMEHCGININDALLIGTTISRYLLLTIATETVSVVAHSNETYSLLHCYKTNDGGYPCSDGNAGAFLFESLQDLVQYLITIYPNEYFQVRPVLLNIRPANATPSNSASPVRTVHAHYHQGDVSLFGRAAGRQCTGIALAFLLLNAKIPVQRWNDRDLFIAMMEGSSLYSNIIEHNFRGGYQYLMHSDLPTVANMFNQQFELVYYHDILFGIIDNHSPDNSSIQSSILQAITFGFQISPSMLLTMGTSTIAIISHDSGTYTVVDSHARNELGVPSPDGTACALEFQSITSLIAYLCKIYTNQVFNLTPVFITSSTSNMPLTQQLLSSKQAECIIADDDEHQENCNIHEFTDAADDQDTAVALMFLILASTQPINSTTKQDLAQIKVNSTSLYNSIISDKYMGRRDRIIHSDMPQFVVTFPISCI